MTLREALTKLAAALDKPARYGRYGEHCAIFPALGCNAGTPLTHSDWLEIHAVLVLANEDVPSAMLRWGNQAIHGEDGLRDMRQMVRRVLAALPSAKPSGNEARDTWLYQKWKAGWPNKRILAELKRKKAWEQLGSEQAVDQAVRRHCKRNGLPVPKRAPSGKSIQNPPHSG